MKRREEVQGLINAAEKAGKPIDLAGQIALQNKATEATLKNRDAIIANQAALNSWDTGQAKALNNYLDNVTSAAMQSNTFSQMPLRAWRTRSLHSCRPAS